MSPQTYPTTIFGMHATTVTYLMLFAMLRRDCANNFMKTLRMAAVSASIHFIFDDGRHEPARSKKHAELNNLQHSTDDVDEWCIFCDA